MADTVDKLMQDYLESFNDKARMVAQAKELAHAGNWQDNEPIAELAELIHRLKGSSGAYGVEELFALTSQVDAQLERIADDCFKIQSLEKLQSDLDKLIAYLAAGQ